MSMKRVKTIEKACTVLLAMGAVASVIVMVFEPFQKKDVAHPNNPTNIPSITVSPTLNNDNDIDVEGGSAQVESNQGNINRINNDISIGSSTQSVEFYAPNTQDQIRSTSTPTEAMYYQEDSTSLHEPSYTPPAPKSVPLIADATPAPEYSADPQPAQTPSSTNISIQGSPGGVVVNESEGAEVITGNVTNETNTYNNGSSCYGGIGNACAEGSSTTIDLRGSSNDNRTTAD